MSAPPPTDSIRVAPIGARKAAIALTVSRARDVPLNPNPVGRNTPVSDSSIMTWLAQLTSVGVAVGEPSAPAVLLVGKENDPDGSARPQAELLHQTQRLPRDDAPAAIVARAGADVP